MDTVPANLQESQPTQHITSPLDCHKALGIHWDTTKDTFHVATPKLEDSATPTKRQVLSDVAKTFNVLGFFLPVTVTLKVLLQKLWQLNLGWDDNIPTKLSGIWSTWRKELPLITSNPIQHFYHSPDRQVHDLQIQGFCDASQQAIAGTVYIRSLYTDTTVLTSLVIAKTKVAPLKTITIPKLELSSAVLLSKLLSAVGKEFGIKPCKMFAWCDSTVALGHTSSKHVLPIVSSLLLKKFLQLSGDMFLQLIILLILVLEDAHLRILLVLFCSGMDHLGYFFHLINGLHFTAKTFRTCLN